MRERLKRLLSPRWLPITVFVFALAAIFAGIGSVGLWEPHEIEVLEQISEQRLGQASVRGLRRSIAEQRDADQKRRGRSTDGSTSPSPARPKCGDEEAALPLGVELVAKSHSLIGGELGARLPNAIALLLILPLLWLFASTAGSYRTGALAVVIFLSFPAVIFGGRQLTGSWLSELCVTAVITASLLVATRWRSQVITVAGAAVAALGIWLGYRSGGILVGVVGPAAAVLIAGIVSLLDGNQDRPRLKTGVLAATTGLAGTVVLLAMGYFVSEVFEWRLADPGQWSLFGSVPIACDGETTALLGEWKIEGDLESTFSASLEELAFGAFPWLPLVPAAFLFTGAALARKNRAVKIFLFAWILSSWAVASIVERKVGATSPTCFGALAVAVAIWVDDYLASARERLQPPIILGLFVGLFAALIAKDTLAFPDEIISVAVPGHEYALPKQSPLRFIPLVYGGLFAVLWFAAIVVRASVGSLRERARLCCAPAALALAVAYTLCTALFAIPYLSTKFSSRETFDVVQSLRQPDEALGVLGRLGAGPAYYAGDDVTTLQTRAALYTFLKRPQRVFALAPVADLCVIHAAQPTHGFDYFVVNDANAKHMLLSNTLDDGQRDRNRLARSIVRERPADIGRPVSVSFDDQLDLIGVKLPKRVGRGDRFKVVLTFQVQKRIRKHWKIFVHFDRNQRFQGDHDPADELCSTTHWRPGDFVVDTFEVTAGGLTYPKGSYKVWAGLFTGSAGNWKNMPVKTPGADKANRFDIGSILVD